VRPQASVVDEGLDATVTTLEERRRLGVSAAREARVLLAQLASEAEPQLAGSVSPIVGQLFSAEVGDAAKVLSALEGAMQQMRALGDVYASEAETMRVLSRAMVLLYPARTDLSRALGLGLREDNTAPFLLDSKRIKPAAQAPGEERRNDDRLEIEVDIALEGDHTFYTGRTGDLSRGGLFVATDEPLLVGSELLLSFILPDGYRVTAEAVVAWVRAPRYRPDELPSGMGLKFVSLGDKDEHAIGHFLKLRPAFRYGD
jgi:uncharacterized protein (TIGR02266 family)